MCSILMIEILTDPESYYQKEILEKISNMQILSESIKKPLRYPYRRCLIRWKTHNRVLFQLENNSEILETQTEDLSSKGACIYINSHPIMTSQKVQMTIFLATTSIIGLTGDIVWISTHSEERRAGILFSNMSVKTQNLILQYTFEMDKETPVSRF